MREAVDAERLEQRYPVLRFFTYAHLPSHLQEVSRPFAVLAWEMAQILTYDNEVSAALRKLLEAKDCCVRTAALLPLGVLDDD